MTEGIEYNITVGFHVGLGCFQATVEEFPDVCSYGRFPGEVYWKAVDAVEGLIALAEDMGHEFPSPHPVADSSGQDR